MQSRINLENLELLKGYVGFLDYLIKRDYDVYKSIRGICLGYSALNLQAIELDEKIADTIKQRDYLRAMGNKGHEFIRYLNKLKRINEYKEYLAKTESELRLSLAKKLKEINIDLHPYLPEIRRIETLGKTFQTSVFVEPVKKKRKKAI